MLFIVGSVTASICSHMASHGCRGACSLVVPVIYLDYIKHISASTTTVR